MRERVVGWTGMRRIVPLAALVTVGCASWQVPRRSELYSRTTPLVAATAWDAARTALVKSGYTVTDEDQASGRLQGVQEFPGPQVEPLIRGTGRYLFTTWWRLRATLTVRVAGEAAGATRISADTALRGEGATLSADRHTAVAEIPLISSGALERRYLETLDLYLADAQGVFGGRTP